MSRSLVTAGTLPTLLAATVLAAPPRDLKTIDVCAFAAGAEVARLAGGSLLDAKRFNAPDGTVARCVFGVALPGKGAEKERTAWVVELFPPGDFDALRPHIDEPVRDVAGIGDGAYEYQSADSGRWRIYAHKRGDVTLSVTGTDEPTVRKIAAFALSRP
jgi:hypothetical protein